jgi:hypothetical protein
MSHYYNLPNNRDTEAKAESSSSLSWIENNTR